jgi:hypothetical protein
MRRSVLVLIVVFAAAYALPAHAEEKLQAPTTQQDAQYEADLNKRADGVLKELNLQDADKAARVKQAGMAQYRAIREIDDKFVGGVPTDDKAAITKAKEDAANAKKPLHDEFLAKLSKDLEPPQVETVKDQMTYNVVKVTFTAFCDELPQLTEAQKSYILVQLKEARELAMDQGSSKEKHAVFGKAKGRIVNYLAKEGYDLKKAEKEWRERIKARQAAATQAAK